MTFILFTIGNNMFSMGNVLFPMYNDIIPIGNIAQYSKNTCASMEIDAV